MNKSYNFNIKLNYDFKTWKNQLSITLDMVHVIVTAPNYLLINMHIDMCIGTKNLIPNWLCLQPCFEKMKWGYIGIKLILVDLIPSRSSL
jgi:hypothetical protein